MKFLSNVSDENSNLKGHVTTTASKKISYYMTIYKLHGLAR